METRILNPFATIGAVLKCTKGTTEGVYIQFKLFNLTPLCTLPSIVFLYILF